MSHTTSAYYEKNAWTTNLSNQTIYFNKNADWELVLSFWKTTIQSQMSLKYSILEEPDKTWEKHTVNIHGTTDSISCSHNTTPFYEK